MLKNLNRLAALALVSVCLSGVAVAQAPATFLQLTQVTNSQQPFVFTNNGVNSFFSVPQFGQPVIGTPTTFDGFSATVNGVNTIVNLTISGIPPDAVTTSPAVSNFPILSQEFNDVRFRVSSVANPSVNILTVDTSSAILFGFQNSTSATLSRSNTGVGNPSVVFTSDIFNFAGSTERAFSFGFSSVDPALVLGGNGFIDSFNAAGVVTFSSNVASLVPEPSAVAFAVITGAGLVGMVVRGRRRRSNK